MERFRIFRDALSKEIGELKFLRDSSSASRYMDDGKRWPADLRLAYGGQVACSATLHRNGTDRKVSRGLNKWDCYVAGRAPGKTVLEQTHIVLFPDGLVGAEFNFHGPRVSKNGRLY